MLGQPILRKMIKGKIMADVNNLESIYIVNLQSENGTMTQNGGYFSIPVKVGDTIMMSSIQFKGKKITITENDLSKELVFIQMQPLMIALDEVKVFQYKNINAVALGIIPKGQKTYTPAERKFNTATNTYFTPNLSGTAGASLIIDPVFNWLSGRTAMLKKEMIVESKEMLLKQLENNYEKEYFITKLKIPEEYVKGFQFYLVENNRFVTTMNSKNKTMTLFLMGELATKYLEIIASEKK
jgi:hypothetical protein